jgi:signal transduction histidine kinase
MDPRTRERALEGFFTTKSQGSGLGLAFVRRVVEAHGGKLLIDSHEGEGTVVRIELRAAS